MALERFKLYKQGANKILYVLKDKVICINNIAVNQFYPTGVVIDGLTLHKVYCVQEYEKVDGDVAIWIIDDNNQYFAYFKNDFMDLDKWRDEQLKKILNNDNRTL